MSIKYTLLISSIFLILSSQNNSVWADYSSPIIAEEDDIKAPQAMHNMAPLMESADLMNLPSLSETTMLPKLDRSMMQDILDKQDVADLMTPFILTNNLKDELQSLNLSRMLQFKPGQEGTETKVLEDLKNQSLKERVKASTEKLYPFFESYFAYQTLD